LLASGIAQAEGQQHIDIPAQSLSSALDNLAKQTKLQMLFDRQLLVGKQSSDLSGDYTGIEAAYKLLAGSGLIVEKTGDNAVSIRRAAAIEPQSATTLKPVNVTATAIRDVTDPYNQDYVLPNATAGTKTDTPIMETPLNVQVISKQVMKDQQVIRLDQALKNVSGVTTGRGRNTGCPVPPAQIPACATNALGSSLEYERQSGNKDGDVII
jgi:iron complex outermembrane receptor protein